MTATAVVYVINLTQVVMYAFGMTALAVIAVAAFKYKPWE